MEELAHGRPTPPFERASLILMLYIDDTIGFRILESGSGDVQIDKDIAEGSLEAKGLQVHKEDWGHGMMKELGVTIRGRPYAVMTQPEKMKELVLATEAIVIAGGTTPSRLSSSLGMWA
eukprot:8058122-Pyramimonas_sp.AAC.1